MRDKGELVVIDGHERRLPPGAELAGAAEVSRRERRNAIGRRISDAIAALGPGATRKDIAAMAGITVATLRRYIGPSREAPDPEGRAVAVAVRRVIRHRKRPPGDSLLYTPPDLR